MTAPTLREVVVTDACHAECAAIRPLTVADACRRYAVRLVRMTDEQLAVEAARVEALPGSEYRALVDEQIQIRRAQGTVLRPTTTGSTR
ncbi:hypothetical protein O7598_31185 [Micromonospora sp. WMMC241]|uniref:hypothetical protein n=1 Tax=Micromonospora sp. WMMC241 TaxID=3015159 RepID=UPI0022B634B5|nr:hypothetical protein [Micromonospora sp. WMMC241]MCZ7434800.1 hypothetical protein [Micromonospora sp. WMMC241]MCZ7440855.1 hypothetical protein [Micromonospora sp. WMMC241]MCZ7440890.1 hypothetical protein [Micromonospora sp. WMMC241]